jgi:hypothetical protein
MSMPDNIQNNWINSLENTDHFPGETLLNKNEAWEKLYKRLHNKPQQKIARWYWMAAACLLIIAAIFLLMNKQEQQPGIAANPSHINKPATGIAKKTILANENNGKLVTISKGDKKTVAPALPKNNSTLVKIETVHNRILDSVNNALLTKTIITPTIHFDSAIATITKTPPKKKLRVVHVNEIDQPAEESTANQFTQKHGFEFRIINNEIYNPLSVPVNNGFILFKSRNTSN